ncbi:MAG: Gmad2 immunoglobulin-like domain-containing protein [Patescibacteria group bacterium]
MNTPKKLLVTIIGVIILIIIAFYIGRQSANAPSVDLPDQSPSTSASVSPKPGTSVSPKPTTSASTQTPSTDTIANLIHVTMPVKDQVVSAPFRVVGEARGPWFFEASFPVVLTDKDGKIIASTHAQAVGNWMTDKFIPFETTITYTQQISGSRGYLILKKDNPSGLPANDASLTIPVRFK